MFRHKYIVIEGNIGAGKTTLAEMLSVKFNARLVLESFAENTFLRQFYKDPERFAFPLEMSFMADRFQQLKRMAEAKSENEIIISDYFFDKCLLFARVNLKPAELKLFENFFGLLKDQLPSPDLLVFLKKDVDHLKKNINRRGRDFEKNIGDKYLHDINAEYNKHLGSLGAGKVLNIDTRELDFVANPLHYSQIVNTIIDC